jgi:hypothetical protein
VDSGTGLETGDLVPAATVEQDPHLQMLHSQVRA